MLTAESLWNKNQISYATYFVLKTWEEINQTMQKYYPSEAIHRLLLEKFATIDDFYAHEFYSAYKDDPIDGKYIHWDDKTAEAFHSAMIRSCDTQYAFITFGFPFQCRQWNFGGLLERILAKIAQSDTQVNLSTLLLIWLIERRKEIFALSKNDLAFLRYTLSRDYFSNHQLLNLREISRTLNTTAGNLSNLLKKLRFLNVYRESFICNLAKLGFITIFSTDNQFLTEYKNFLLCLIHFSENEVIGLVNIPAHWVETQKYTCMNTFQYGYSLAAIRPHGKISTAINIPLFSFSDHSELINHHHTTIVDLVPKNCYINTKSCEEAEEEVLTDTEFKLLLHFNPAYYQLFNAVTHLAQSYNYSETTIRVLLQKLNRFRFIYPFISVNFVGFPEKIAILARGSHEILSELQFYLMNFFHYRFYRNQNLLLAFIWLSCDQLEHLQEQLHIHQHKFDSLLFSVFEEGASFIQKSVDIHNLQYITDDFWGIQWKPLQGSLSS